MVDSILGMDTVRKQLADIGSVAITASTVAAVFGNSYRELVTPAESVIAHLIRLTWLEEDSGSDPEPGLRLTELGRALLRDFEVEIPAARMSAS